MSYVEIHAELSILHVIITHAMKKLLDLHCVCKAANKANTDAVQTQQEYKVIAFEKIYMQGSPHCLSAVYLTDLKARFANGSSLLANIGAIVSYLILVGTCSDPAV